MKTLNFIILLLFTVTVLMAGLITTFNSLRKGFDVIDLKYVSIGPESYLNKKISVVGNVYQPDVLFDYRNNGIRQAISKEDELGFYSIFLKSYNNKWITPGKYRINGIINYVDVCVCEYRCVDYKGKCVYVHKYLYLPNMTIKNFRTNLTSNPIKDYWYPDYYYYSKIIVYLCPVDRKDYFYCSYEMKGEFDPFSLDWKKFDGIFYKEYRCRENSLERVYYIEVTEPAIRL